MIKDDSPATPERSRQSEPAPPPTPSSSTRQAVHEFSEDALGFGMVELRTARDLLIRPAAVLEAWMTGGATGHGRYTRPLRFYLALNAILMLILFFKGGSGYLLEQLTPDQLARMVEVSGKSHEAFVSRADGWMTLTMVPLLAAIYVLAVAPLLAWWDREKLGWRGAFRAGYAYLNAWTVPILPIAWFSYGGGVVAVLSSLVLLVLGFAAFMRMGRGRWYQGWLGGLGKAAVLMGALTIAAVIGGQLVVAIGLYAAAVA